MPLCIVLRPLSVAFFCFPQSKKKKKITHHSKQMLLNPSIHFALTEFNSSVYWKVLGQALLNSHCTVFFFYPVDWPVWSPNIFVRSFCFLWQNCTLLSSWFPPLTVALPFCLPLLISSSLLLLLLCCLLLLPALPPSGWRVSIVCNDSVLSAGFQIDTPDTLGRTCLHAAAAGGWGSKRSGLISKSGPFCQ